MSYHFAANDNTRYNRFCAIPVGLGMLWNRNPCAAYSLAMKGVCDLLGIECGLRSSPGHVWPVIPLEHVDLSPTSHYFK